MTLAGSGRDLLARCDALAAISSQADGLTRLSFTDEHRQANALVSGWMRAAGLSVTTDAIGNLVGRYEGLDPGAPALMIGSHLDTVRDAGRYDGMLGVVAGIAAMAEWSRAGIRKLFAVEIVGFADEEGTRFQSTLLGSRAVAGTFDAAALSARDGAGLSLGDAMRDFGLDPDRIGTAARKPGDLVGYVELHIEQGPVLDAKAASVGIVTAIAGATRCTIRVGGQAGHAGTVPMDLRRDALAGTAEMVLAVERIARAHPGLVGTVGRIGARPGAVNVIPGEAEFSVDVRSGSDDLRKAGFAELLSVFSGIAVRRGLTMAYDVTHDAPACVCDDRLIDRLSEAARAEGHDVILLPSGAGHDAMAFSGLTPVGMIFVRCTAGISHNPAEAITAEDAGAGLGVLMRFLNDFEGTL